MSFKNDYLDMIARLRTYARRLTLQQRRIIVASILLVLLVLILSIDISPFGYLIAEGKPSPRVILAPATVQYVDRARTRDQQNAAAAAVQDVYLPDSKVSDGVIANLNDLLRIADETAALPGDPGQNAAAGAARLQDKGLAGDLTALLALSPQKRREVRDVAVHSVGVVMDKGVSTGSLDAARSEARTSAGNSTTDVAVRQVAGQISADTLKPNLVIDRVETDRRREAAREAIKPVITTKLQGEVIVSKGEVVTREEVDLLKSLGFKQPTFTPLKMLYTAVFVLLFLAAVAMYLARFRRMYYDSPGLLVLLGGTIVMYAAIAKVLTVAASSWSPAWGYLMPSAAVAMIVAVLFDSGTALVMVAFCGLITGVVTGGNFSLVTLAFLGGILPSLYASRTSNRHQLRRVGLYTAFWVAAVAFCASALTQTHQGMLLNTGIGFLNGAICTVLAMGSLPFLETTFRVTTNTWLLELASPDEELLKELSVKAPGTYTHSVMVANLAEAAARQIGGDQMLARVASYYHDVGKIKRPQFFVENQLPDANPHDGMSPSLSALVIIAHVKDGVEMLEKNHIPPDLVEIIKQHHGTSIVRYFYEKALEADPSVDEEPFRYHHPKPHRRTAGILMLADSVEATARTLDHPSAASIEQMVDRIVEGKLADGQLDECSLTFDELNKLKTAFSKVLIGTYHPRIDYPAEMATRARENARKNKHPAAGLEPGGAPPQALDQGDGKEAGAR